MPTVPVRETFQDQPVWAGVIHVFDIAGNPNAIRAYAWSSPIEGSEKRRFFTCYRSGLSRRQWAPLEWQSWRSISSEGYMSESRKQGAERAREAYLNQLIEHGIQLVRIGDTREVVYKTVSGKTVRIPFAREKTKGDEWWWGLPDRKDFDIVVLLCETRAGLQHDFVLPAEFLLPLWDLLSKDAQGGVNFDVIDRGHSDYRLVVGRGRLKPIANYLGRIELLS